MSVKVNLKILASDSLIYGFSGILSRFIGVFLTPIYTRVYSPDDYGIIGILGNGFILISILLVFSLDNSTARWFYDTENNQERKKIINSWLYFYLLASLFMAIFIFATSEYWAIQLLDGYPEGSYLIKLLAISLPLLVWPTVSVNILRFERKAKQAVFLSLFQSLVLIGLNVLFVLILRKGVQGVYYAQLAGAVLTLPLSLYFLRSWLGKPQWFNLRIFKDMIKYAIPFVPASLGYWAVNLSGVFFVNEYLPKSEVGLYQIGISIAALAGLATTAFQQAWSPFAFSILNHSDSKDVYAASLQLYVFIVGLICTIISVFAYEALVLLTTPQYYNAAIVASILTFNYFLMGLSNIAGLGASIAKKTAPLGLINLISAVLLVCLNFIFIPFLGKEGAAISIVISQLIIPVYMFRKSQILYPIPFKFGKNIKIFLIFITCSLIAYQLPSENFAYSILMKIALLTSAFVGLAWMNRNELKQINYSLKKKI
ncbi:MAG: oligosaccharide flippase family protein [Flavobacteriales bacterium]|nr:oligosaccharide flippase family protein [Flavobacteriales bacterium]